MAGSFAESVGLAGPPDASPAAPPPSLSEALFSPRQEGPAYTPPPDLETEFSRGARQGIDSMQQGLYGVARLAGRELGVSSLEEFGQKGVDYNQMQLETGPAPTVSQIADVQDAGDFFRYAAGQLGAATPMLATMLGTGGITGAVVKKVLENGLRRAVFDYSMRTLTEKGFSSEAASLATQRVLGSEAGRKMLIGAVTSGKTAEQVLARGGRLATIGAITGVTAPIEAGNIDIETGGKSPMAAVVGGLGAGFLFALPEVRLLNRMFPGVETEVARSFTADLVKGMGLQTAIASGSMTGAEAIHIAAMAYNDPTFDPFSPDSLHRLTEAFAAGAVLGAVTGGGAEAVRGGIPALHQFAKSAKNVKARIPAWSAKEEFGPAPKAPEAADNTFMQELHGRVTSLASDILDPIVNSVRYTGQKALDAINSELGGGMNLEARRLAGIISDVHRSLVTENKGLLTKTRDYLNDQVKRIAESAKSLSDPVERERMVTERIAKIREEIDNIGKILKRRADEKNAEAKNKVEAADMSWEPDGNIFERTPVQFRFGKNNEGGRVSENDLYNPPEGEIPGFTTKKGARNLKEQLKQNHPSATDDMFSIVKQKDGTYVVEINDPAGADLLMQDNRVTRALNRARLSARRNPDKSRHIELNRGNGKKTRVDMPTLIYAARDLPDVFTHNQAVATILGHLTDRGFLSSKEAENIGKRFSKKTDKKINRTHEIERDLESLPPDVKKDINKRVNEQLEAEGRKGNDRAGRRLSLLEDEIAAYDADKQRQRMAGVEDQGDNIDSRPQSEEAMRQRLPTEDQQARESISRRPENKRIQVERKALDDTFNKKAKLKVYMPGADEKVQRAVHDLVSSIQDAVGIDTELRVVNVEGLRAMIRKGHPDGKLITSMNAINRGSIGRMLWTDEGRAYIIIDTAKSETRQIPIIAGHELGHVVHYETWDALTPEGKIKLRDAFVKDLESGDYGKSRLRGRDEPVNDEAEFKEWMADQLVAWSNRRSEPRNFVEKFFRDLGLKIKALYDNLTGASAKRFLSLDETYNDFITAVAKRSTENPNDIFFRNENRNSQFSLPPRVEDIKLPVPIKAPIEVVDSILKRYENRYPEIVKRATLIRNWIHKAYSVMAAPSTSVISDIGKRVPAARKLVNIFGRHEHGKAKENQNYHQAVYQRVGLFRSRYVDITKGLSDAEKTSIVQSLRAMDGQPVSKTGAPDGAAGHIRKLFDDIHDYLFKDAKLPIGKIENYFPKMFSRDKLLANQDAIIKHLMDKEKMPRRKAESFFNSLVSSDADRAAALRELGKDELSMQTPGFRNMRSRSLKDPFFDSFLEDNLDNIVANYINSAVKRGEFNRFMGMDSSVKAGWKPRGRLDALLKNAEAQGASTQELKYMKMYVDANLGMLGRDFDRALPGARTAMAGMIAYQNMRVLMFTVFASLPDLVGPAIRAGSMRDAFSSTIKNIRSIAKSEGDLHEMARTWGIVSDVASDHIMTEYVDNHFMPPRLRKWNEAFFKYTGLNWYTDATRKMALAVGKDYIKNQARLVTEGQTEKARLKAEAALKELGLNKKHVDSWVNDGEQVWDGSTGGNISNRAVAEALVQFVDESIMRPNAAQRPLLASHPSMMLLYHLKGYMYAMYETVIKRMAYNFKIAETPAQTAAAIAPAIAILGLTALGLELRELVQYGTGPSYTDRMSGWDYTWELMERSGLTGPTQLAFDFEGADRWGTTGLAAVGGPTLGQFAELLSKPPSQSIPHSVPVIGQLPWARNALREATPL